MSDLLFAIITTASTTLRRILHRALYSIGKKRKKERREPLRLAVAIVLRGTFCTCICFLCNWWHVFRLKEGKGPGRCKQVIDTSPLRACVRAWRSLMGHVGTSMRGIVLAKLCIHRDESNSRSNIENSAINAVCCPTHTHTHTLTHRRARIPVHFALFIAYTLYYPPSTLICSHPLETKRINKSVMQLQCNLHNQIFLSWRIIESYLCKINAYIYIYIYIHAWRSDN